MKPKKFRVARTRNSETMTESMFWLFIRSGLRQKSMFWKPIQEAKKASRRPYTGPNKRQKFEYHCTNCNKYYKEKEVIVDHIVEAGSLRTYADLPGFVERLFCERDGFTTLCIPCHHIKTHKTTPKTKLNGRK